MSTSANDAPDFDPIAAVEASRERGATLVDPVGFAVIAALARRALAQQGEARQRLILRVEELLAEHAMKPAPRQPPAARDEFAGHRSALAQLSALVDQLGRSPTSHVAPPSSPRRVPARQNDNTARTAPLTQGAAPAPRNAVTAFKSTWSRLRAEQRLRQALAQVPAAAGPLNSSHVINRTLQAMRDLSPEYLDAFMQHVDTLLWLEQASGGGDLAPRAATPAEGGRGPGARPGRKG
ncbi:MAG TPA: DUF2894 domain-containing protein [Burkholderiaceae bacterium]